MAVKFCVKCGAPLKEGAKFCTKCGWKLPEAKESTISNQDRVVNEQTKPEIKMGDEEKLDQVPMSSTPMNPKENERRGVENTPIRSMKDEAREEPGKRPSKYDIRESSSHEVSTSYAGEAKRVKTGPTTGNLITISLSSVIILIMSVLLIMELL